MGIAALRLETPRELEFDVEMQTDGLLVVSDLWDPSRLASVDDQPVGIHRAYIARRGIALGQERHVLKMTYAPRSVARAFQRSIAATIILVGWTLFAMLRRVT